MPFCRKCVSLFLHLYWISFLDNRMGFNFGIYKWRIDSSLWHCYLESQIPFWSLLSPHYNVWESRRTRFSCQYIIAVSAVIVGLVPYYRMDPDTPITSAFASHGIQGASYIITI
uniref:Cationic amino acid transporter 2, vacuolar-like isoform X1 n=1 Tax=Tanacetum cinerariifolium TaxID=118510 RepID=A0A6L2LCT2_TANCI|nr:cationic amino acid transporter 2, vacuolar-like isoform X1 [Tanacetum cinerariifolium]